MQPTYSRISRTSSDFYVKHSSYKLPGSGSTDDQWHVALQLLGHTVNWLFHELSQTGLKSISTGDGLFMINDEIFDELTVITSECHLLVNSFLTLLVSDNKLTIDGVV